jgi:hypothetical protein
MAEHTHECRRCGSSIECYDDDSPYYQHNECWSGDNTGCPNEAAENAAERLVGGYAIGLHPHIVHVKGYGTKLGAYAECECGWITDLEENTGDLDRLVRAAAWHVSHPVGLAVYSVVDKDK